MKLDDVNLLQFGNTVQLIGAIWQGEGQTFLCMFPEEDIPPEEIEGVEYLHMDTTEWQRFLRQTDLMETEVLVHANDGTVTKAILRKSARQIDQAVSWRVFRRDDYTCRYCGRDDVPLTVDHLVLWEEGGPSIEENLLSACKKCNRKRGNTQFEDWLSDPYFLKVSVGLAENQRSGLRTLVHELPNIPRVRSKPMSKKLPQVRVVCLSMDGEELSSGTITLNKKILNRRLTGIQLFHILSSAEEAGGGLVATAFETLLKRMEIVK